MRFTEADPAIDEERVIMVAGLIRHGHRRCVSKLIAGANDKILKRIPWYQITSSPALLPFALVLADFFVCDSLDLRFLLDVQGNCHLLLCRVAQHFPDLRQVVLS